MIHAQCGLGIGGLAHPTPRILRVLTFLVLASLLILAVASLTYFLARALQAACLRRAADHAAATLLPTGRQPPDVLRV